MSRSDRGNTGPGNPRPPRLASFLLRHFAHRYQREALIGDLLEEHAAGRTSAWLWWQVICALGSSAQLALRRQLPLLALLVWWGIVVFLSCALWRPLVLLGLDPTLYWLLRRRRRLKDAARTMAPHALVWVCLAFGLPRPAAAAEAVTFDSGERVLHGLIYKPAGRGPFPAVLYNHGSAPGLLSSEAFELIGPMHEQSGRSSALWSC